MRCPKCGHETHETAKFCDECGANLQPTQSQSDSKTELTKTKGVTESERKHVTALFSDLAGYTSMTERMDPEQVKEITGRIFTGVKEIVAKYEGFVDRLMGDGVLAFFGILQAHEDYPIRAIRAALEIHEFVKGLSPIYEAQTGRPLSMHSGINTGLVVTAEVDLVKGTQEVAGEAVNVASRLSGLAGPGEILVGEETARGSRGCFDFQDLGLKQVKGKTKPVQVYRVTGIKEKQERSMGIDSPLVGRQKELDLLSLQVYRLINGTGGIVTVTGEAGIGKSRLMAELHRTEAVKKTMLLEGRALSIGRTLSFYPIIDALKHWAQIKEDDTDSESQRKLEKAIRAIHPEEASEIFPFIATLMGMRLTGKHTQRMKGIAGEALEKLIFKNMRELLIKGSELRPIMIYIEDFHWVDTSSLELIEALFRLVEGYRILFILVFRPGYADTGERIIKSIGENYPTHWTRIELDALNETESETLLSNLLRIKGLPPHIRDQILQRAGGNPFFIEEVLRSLIDEGAVVLKNGEYEVTEKINQIVIPQSIHALIMTRIDRLDEATRNLVRMASVIGRNFFYRILTEVASTIEEIDRKLDYLKEIQLIRERKRMEELEYLFKHALAQETAYESILIQRRKELHNKVAQSIEKVFNERLHEFYGMLAYHYGMGEDLDKSEEYMIKAGEEAMKSAASSEAIGYFQEALSVYRSKLGEKASPEKIAMLEKNIAYALLNRGRHLESIDYFTRVLEYHGERFPETSLGIAMKLTNGLLHLLVGLYLPALKWRRIPTERDKEILYLYHYKALALSQPDPKRFFIESIFLMKRITAVDLSRVQNGYGMLSSFSVLFSWPGISKRISKKILDFTKNKIDHHDVRAYAHYLFADFFHDYCMGNFVSPDPALESLTDQMIKVGELFYGLMMILWPGVYFAATGQFAKAIEMVEKMNAVYREYNQDAAGAISIITKTGLLLQQGHLEEALRAFEEGIPFVDKKISKNMHFVMHSYKAAALLLSGEIEEAKGCFEYLETIRVDIPLAPNHVTCYLTGRFGFALHLLERAMKTGDASYNKYVQEARFWGKESLKICKKHNHGRVQAKRLMGTFLWLTGKKRDALKWWRLSVKTGESFKMKPELARTYFVIGKRLSELNSPYGELNDITAAEYLNKARNNV